MIAKLHPDMPIYDRTRIIAEALARVLDRGPEMSVETTGPAASDLGLYVIMDPYSDKRICHDLDAIARDLERFL